MTQPSRDYCPGMTIPVVRRRRGWFLRRLSARSFRLLRRNRFEWLAGIVAVLAVGVGAAVLPATSRGSDCADQAMAAAASGSAEAVRSVYRQCLAPGLAASIPEEDFIAMLTDPERGDTQRVTRVADYPMAEGGRIAYFAIVRQDTTLAYAVYLLPDGKVFRVE